jgi:UDP-3-O-[3-hydroxymyristoyl] glucosamine N-acyltransferase
VSILDSYSKTCSINDLKDDSVTFAKRVDYLLPALSTTKRILIMVPSELDLSSIGVVPKNITLHIVDNVDYNFTVYHNRINYGVKPAVDVYGENVFVHSSVEIFEGVRVSNAPDGSKVQLKHMGNVVFGDNVRVGALTLIERGCLSSTIIRNGVHIDGRVTIGHNSIIEENTVIATGAVIGGSAKVGKNCWVGLNAVIKNGVKVCDNVVVGMCAAVVKDISESGVYAGVPAILKKRHGKGYNF